MLLKDEYYIDQDLVIAQINDDYSPYCEEEEKKARKFFFEKGVVIEILEEAFDNWRRCNILHLDSECYKVRLHNPGGK